MRCEKIIVLTNSIPNVPIAMKNTVSFEKSILEKPLRPHKMNNEIINEKEINRMRTDDQNNLSSLRFRRNL